MDSPTRLRSLTVRDFRNLEHIELAPPDEGLVVVGDNGHGKTNLLEAIYYLQVLRSARGVRDVDLVRFGAPGFHVGAAVTSDRAHEIGAGFERAGRRKRVRIDGVVRERLADAVGALPAVMFSPADVDLIAGAPAMRRRFLDIVLGVTSRAYLRALQRYRAALVRRNAVLRSSDVRAARRGAHAGVRAGNPPSAAAMDDGAALEVWEAPLAEHGATLWSARRTWVAGVRARFAEHCAAIGEERTVSLRYASAIPDDATDDEARERLACALAEQRAVDRKLGLTRSGPHRDDLVVAIASPGASGADRDLRTFGSGGQQRTAAIALRLLEGETLRERRGGAPLVLLDDPFAELDARRSARIVELLGSGSIGLGQTVLAVPRASDIPVGLPRLERYRITHGALTHE